MSHACSSCGRQFFIDLSCDAIPHIECQVCRNDEDASVFKRFCLHCFTNFDKHDPTHPYAVVPNFDCNPSPFPSPPGDPVVVWTQRQDLALISGVEKLGLGNWEDVAKEALKGVFTPLACKLRFQLLRHELMPPPPPPLVQLPPSPPPIAAAAGAATASMHALPQISGYSALRQEFECVFANEAEQKWLADMVFDDCETRDEVEKHHVEEFHKVKLHVLRMYNLMLDEREFRNRVVLKQDLLDFSRLQKVQNVLRTPLRDGEDELTQELIFFDKFTDVSALQRGLEAERQLRQELHRLREVRLSGGGATVTQNNTSVVL